MQLMGDVRGIRLVIPFGPLDFLVESVLIIPVISLSAVSAREPPSVHSSPV
jgi:hypothetical protein